MTPNGSLDWVPKSFLPPETSWRATSPVRSIPYKGRESRLVRGRQILNQLDSYLATKALPGSAYDMEDLFGRRIELINDSWVHTR